MSAVLPLVVLSTPLGEVKDAETYSLVGAMLVAFFALFLLVMSMWRALPSGYTRLLPAMAAALMLIPVVGSIWQMLVFAVFARNYGNWSREQAPDAPSFPMSLAIAHGVLVLVSTIGSHADASWLPAVEVPQAVVLAALIWRACVAIDAIEPYQQEHERILRRLQGPNGQTAEVPWWER